MASLLMRRKGEMKEEAEKKDHPDDWDRIHVVAISVSQWAGKS